MALLWRPHLTRVPPAHPAQAYRTYTLAVEKTPPSDCRDVGCAQWRDGWMTVTDPDTEMGRAQAALIRSGKTNRRYAEGTTAVDTDGGDVRVLFDGRKAGPGEPVAFWFYPGQRCFRAPHQVPDGPEHYFVRGGDHRGGPPIRTHTRAIDWVEDMNDQQHRRAVARERG